MYGAALVCALMGLMALSSVHGTVYFHEEFKSLDHWTNSKHSPDYGKVELSAGKFFADAEKSKGLRLMEDAHFYALSTKFNTPITNENKDLVVSFSVKHEQGIKCGGGYIKVLPEMDPEDFHGDTKYWLMFGPDICGLKNKVHIIFHYNGKNHEWNQNVQYPDDKLTHVYTLHITPSNTYTLYIDGESKANGELESDWSMLPPKEIPDPEDKKPEDWEDEAMIPDPEDKKPEDWDNEPESIKDPNAKKPEDWDDEEDGEWEAPEIENPKAKGKWEPRQIPNPAYKGVWEPRLIPNPEYKADAHLYKTPEPLKHVGIDVWQVESGSIFKDIIIGDDVTEVLNIVQNTYSSMKKAESEALQAMEAKKMTESSKKETAEKEENEGEETEATEEEGEKADL